MAKSRDFAFRVKATDEALMFARVDCEAEGLYSKMRRDAFRGEPRGFLVDFRGTAISPPDLADGYCMSNGRFKARFEELHHRQIIQTASEYEESLLGLKSAWSSKKILVFRELLDLVKSKPAEVFVIPALVDDLLDTIIGERTARNRSQSVAPPLQGTPIGGSGTPPPEGTPIGGPSGPPGGTHSHSHVSKSESKSASPVEEKNARDHERPEGDLLRMQAGNAPWSWKKHMFLCDATRKWRAAIPEDVLHDRDRYAGYFQAEFGFELAIFELAQDIFEHGPLDPPLPPACLDGDHVADDAGSCKNCRARVSA